MITQFEFFAVSIIILLLIFVFEKIKKLKNHIKITNSTNEKLEIELKQIKSKYTQHTKRNIDFTFFEKVYDTENRIISHIQNNFSPFSLNEIYNIDNIERYKTNYDYIDDKVIYTTTDMSNYAVIEKTIVTSNKTNNIKQGITENILQNSKITFTEKYDSNNKLTERIQNSNIALYEDSRRTYSYENGNLFKIEIFESNKFRLTENKNSTNEPDYITYYFYDNENNLSRSEFANMSNNKIEILYYFSIRSINDYSEAINKCINLCNLNSADIYYLYVLSELLFRNNKLLKKSCEFEVSNKKLLVNIEY